MIFCSCFNLRFRDNDNVNISSKEVKNIFSFFDFTARPYFKVKAVSATFSGHRTTLTSWVRLRAWGFLLMFYINHLPITRRFCSIGMGQTDRRTDGRITASFNAFKPSVSGIINVIGKCLFAVVE